MVYTVQVHVWGEVTLCSIYIVSDAGYRILERKSLVTERYRQYYILDVGRYKLYRNVAGL